MEKKIVKEKDDVLNIVYWLLCALLLTVFFVFSNFVVEFTFNLFDYTLILSVFSYPFVFLFANVITKKFGSTKTLISITAAVIVQALVFLVVHNFDPEIIKNSTIIGSLVSFTISQFINLALYMCVMESKRLNVGYLILIYFLAIFVDNTIFMSTMNTVDLGMAFILSTIIKMLVAFVLIAMELVIFKKVEE